MKSGNLQGLLDRARAGDARAAQELQRAMQPVLSRAVRQILQAQDYDTPLGQRVWGVLAEDGIPRGSDPSDKVLAAEVPGPLTQRVRSPSFITANGGPHRSASSNPSAA